MTIKKPIAETNRTLIRPLAKSDIDWLYKLLSNHEIMRFSEFGPLNKNETEQWLNKCIQFYKKNNYGKYAIFLKETHEPIGMSGFEEIIIDTKQTIAFSYRLFAIFWGQGFGYEIAKQLVHFGLNQLNFAELISIIEPKHTTSIKLANKLGFNIYENTALSGKNVSIYKKINDFTKFTKDQR